MHGYTFRLLIYICVTAPFFLFSSYIDIHPGVIDWLNIYLILMGLFGFIMGKRSTVEDVFSVNVQYSNDRENLIHPGIIEAVVVKDEEGGKRRYEVYKGAMESPEEASPETSFQTPLRYEYPDLSFCQSVKAACKTVNIRFAFWTSLALIFNFYLLSDFGEYLISGFAFAGLFLTFSILTAVLPTYMLSTTPFIRDMLKQIIRLRYRPYKHRKNLRYIIKKDQVEKYEEQFRIDEQGLTCVEKDKLYNLYFK